MNKSEKQEHNLVILCEAFDRCFMVKGNYSPGGQNNLTGNDETTSERIFFVSEDVRLTKKSGETEYTVTVSRADLPDGEVTETIVERNYNVRWFTNKLEFVTDNNGEPITADDYYSLTENN